jgi:hypothetical protein
MLGRVSSGAFGVVLSLLGNFTVGEGGRGEGETEERDREGSLRQREQQNV